MLDALASHIDKVLDAFHEFGVRTRWKETVDSPLENERIGALRQYGPGGGWDAATPNYAGSNGVLFTAVAGQHLEGISALLRAREIIFAPSPLARAILEIAGHVFWLLDPGVHHVRDRAARVWLAQIQDTTRRKTAAVAVSHPGASRVGAAVRELRTKTVPSLFYPSEVGKGPRGTITLRGQAYPGFDEILGYISRASSVPWNTSGMYAYLSNASHPTLHIITDSLHVEGNEITGFGLRDVTLPYRIVRMALACVIRCWRLTAAYHGLDQEEAGGLEEEINALPVP